jgi:hypothetical protein
MSVPKHWLLDGWYPRSTSRGIYTVIIIGFKCIGRTLFILGSLGQRSRSLTINRIFDNRVVSARYKCNFSSVYWIFNKLGHMIPLWKGKNHIYFGVIRSKVTITIKWPSLLKIQYTELKLSGGNDPVVRNSIYSNGDLDRWPNDPKINKVLPLPQGNHVAKFGKDPIYRTKVIVWKPVWTPTDRHTQSHNMARL